MKSASAVDQLMAAALAPAPARSDLVDQLGKLGADLTDRQSRVVRALDILARHPEFEEFLELQELLEEIHAKR